MGTTKGKGIGAPGHAARDPLEGLDSPSPSPNTSPKILDKRTTKVMSARSRLTRSSVTLRAYMYALHCGQIAQGWSQAEVNDRAGTDDGYFQKALAFDSQSGRFPSWPTLDLLTVAVYGRNFIITISRGEDDVLPGSPRIVALPPNNAANRLHWRFRKHFQELGKLGAESYLKNTTAEQREANARRAAKARWRKHRAKSVQS